MGLTNSSVGHGAVDSGLIIKKQNETDMVVALAGNPNVGKSTVFNALTGMNQHTGNWPGKTVSNAQGYAKSRNRSYVMIDIPGTYSLMAHSTEEEVARNFICFGNPDAVAVVCDATCLERNMNLVLQTLEITPNVVVCVNLLDEAKRKQINVDLKKIESRLGVPVVGTIARKKKTLNAFMQALDNITCYPKPQITPIVSYPEPIENAIRLLEPTVRRLSGGRLNSRWLSLRLLDCDISLKKEIEVFLGEDFFKNPELFAATDQANHYLAENSITRETLKDMIVASLMKEAETITRPAVTYNAGQYSSTDRRLDKIFTSRATGYPAMLLLLALIFWITIVGANIPSEFLSHWLFKGQDLLNLLFLELHAPDWLRGAIVFGVYRVLAWVVSVMLPPMAIFFPLFTLLEDSGYLPRIAYNLDRPFKRCNACGKQALTMCMGFGCNAAGIVGCRIIDSQRERLLAILTNNFVPCNGRFPTIIAILTMFFIGNTTSSSSLISALLLTAVILAGILTTFLATKLLSTTLLKGIPSSFTLELPPYRRPQIGKVLIRSIFDRTLFVLGRAAAVAAPAGLILWMMANITVDNISLLRHCADFLDPFARFMGIDGVILIAFVLGFPANEIVIPIILMAYLCEGSLVELGTLSQMRELFIANGWNLTTAICVIIFSLMHWPCSTTLITIKKETGSYKWTALAAILPTAFGMVLCIIINAISKLI